MKRIFTWSKLKKQSLLVIALSFITSTVLSPLTVLASSPYDTAYRTTDTVHVRNSTSCSGSGNVDITVDWYSIFSDPDAWETFANGYSSRLSLIDNFDSSKIAWGVSQYNYTNGNSEYDWVRVFWTDDDELLDLQWLEAPGTNYVSLLTGVNIVDIWLNHSCEIKVIDWRNVLSGTSAKISDNNAPTVMNFSNLFATGFNPNYPSGYEGDPINEGGEGKTAVYPTIVVNIEYNQNTAAHTITLTLDPQFTEIYGLPNPDIVILTLTNEDDEIILPSDDQGWLSRYTNILPGIYKAHSFVYYNDESINNQYDFLDTWFIFEANGTSYIIFYDSQQNKYCSVRSGYENNCQISQPQDEEKDIVTGEPGAYIPETCDITHIGGCIANAFHWLGEYFGITPNTNASPFFQFDTNTFGLTAIVTAPISILNSLQTASYTCSPVSLPLPNTDTNITLPCLLPYYENNLGLFFVMWQAIITGIVSYFILGKLLNDVKDFKDPKNDKIEWFKL